MSYPFLNCPSCGAMLELRYRHSKMTVCKYCGQTSYINIDGLTAAGSPILLADYGSVLSVGKRGTIKEKSFDVVGRLRFNYEDGFWDEWLILMDGETESWLQEDEGEFTLFKKHVIAKPPGYSGIFVGTEVQIETQKVFITEKNRAVINGGEGELPFRVIAGEKVDYIDGLIVGKELTASLEYMSDGVVYSIGEPMSLNDFQFK